MKANQRQAERPCPFCHTQTLLGEDACVCLDCYACLHQRCWRQNGGCSTYGCVSAPAGTLTEVSISAEPRRGAPRPAISRRAAPRAGQLSILALILGIGGLALILGIGGPYPWSYRALSMGLGACAVGLGIRAITLVRRVGFRKGLGPGLAAVAVGILTLVVALLLRR